MDSRMGLCRVCHNTKICLRRSLSQQEKADALFDLIGEQVFYEVIPHNYHGKFCEGSNDVPVMLIAK